jgi:UDP-N-acetylglucosamine:LPS N-acetylglucosamine transferase
LSISKEPKKILIPYFLAGSGHLVSARAIEHFIREKRPDWEVRLFEPADEFKSKPLDTFFRRSWQLVLNSPAIAAMGFSLLNAVFPFIPIAVNTRIMRREMPHARNLLENYRPDLIITTHWGCGHLLQSTRIAYGIDIPLYLVRNDLGGAFQIQDCGCDITFVMSSNAKQAFEDLGIPADRVRQVNLLVRPQFLTGDDKRDTARFELGIAGDETAVLLSSGGEGVGSVEEYAKATLDAAIHYKRPLKLIVLTGRNEALMESLIATLDETRAIVLPYREDMDALMAASDIVVGKCGANYTMETLMMGKPFIITQVAAPSEEYNKEYVVSNGYGWHAPTVSEYADVLGEIFDGDQTVSEVSRRLSRIPRHSGAEEIADIIIQRLSA